MARGGYAPLPGFQGPTHSTIEDEMEQAFESDDEDQNTIPLTQQATQPISSVQAQSQAQEGTYDFEREYDHPPPGSPPASSVASGNSNGIIPSPSSILRPDALGHRTKPSFFRRAVGALLPQHYARVPTRESEVVGGGLDNDGVFSNVSARPSAPRAVRDEHGDVHVMPEDAQDEAPPSYAAAQADASPPYWETTIHAPSLGGSDDLLIEGLPAGSIFSFAWNFLISVSFQFVGFMLTYLLSTSHAAKYGSRAGLGVTLIQYGLFSRAETDDILFGGDTNDAGATTSSTQRGRLGRRDSMSLYPRFWSTSPEDQGDHVVMVSNGIIHDWLSFVLMTVGWILLISSIFGFIRVKRWERSIRTPTPPIAITPEARQRDAEVRSRLAEVFGLEYLTQEEEDETQHQGAPMANDSPNQNPNFMAMVAQHEQLRGNLSAAGLI